jgi:DNA-directed RNA polymerase specialized sigma24 family protein
VLLVLDQQGSEFANFLNDLYVRSPLAWERLTVKLRKRLIPMLNYKTSLYPSNALQTKTEFIEEVFEETLLKFADILPSCTFNDYSGIEAMAVTISRYKLQEGFARLRREQRLHLMETEDLNRLAEERQEETLLSGELSTQHIERAKVLIEQLNEIDKDILIRFFEGEELNKIAEDHNLSAHACRKRKQRAMDLVRSSFFKTSTREL